MKTPFYSIMYRTFHAQRNDLRPYMETIGLSQGQPKILNYLVIHDRCKQVDLATSCDIKAATVSTILNNMEESGLIKRLNHVSDRRSGCITITDKGRIAQAKWMEHCVEIEEKSLANFTDEEKAQFTEYLCRMYKNLSDKEME